MIEYKFNTFIKMYSDLCTYIVYRYKYTYILSDEVITTQNTYIPSAER